MVFSHMAPPSIEPILESGGIETDLANAQMFSVNPSNGKTVLSPTGQIFIDGGTTSIKKNNRRYSIPESLTVRNTTGIVRAILDHDHSAWVACRQKHATARAVVFHAGSHNCGGSHAEAAIAVHQIVQDFLTWQKESGEEKCLIFVSTPDVHHERIADVGQGKFGEQQHFRNSFRINSFNNALKMQVSHEKRKYGVSNVHFLDTFHFSLGLHWSGHAIKKGVKILDPVHFYGDFVYGEFARLVWNATQDLCGI